MEVWHLPCADSRTCAGKVWLERPVQGFGEVEQDGGPWAFQPGEGSATGLADIGQIYPPVPSLTSLPWAPWGCINYVAEEPYWDSYHVTWRKGNKFPLLWGVPHSAPFPCSIQTEQASWPLCFSVG